MIPLEFDAVTAIAVVLVAAILAVYLSVLKRTGWIGHAVSYQSKPNSQENVPFGSIDSMALETGKGNLELDEEIENGTQVDEPEENVDLEAEEQKIILKQKLAQKLIEAQQYSAMENASPQCTHKFGYLSALKKKAEIPDECYSCTQLIQCVKEPKNVPQEEKNVDRS
ncbi:MAG: hypothetical protein ACLQO7_01675 [Candidatus Bathyarchaeia archaeon]